MVIGDSHIFLTCSTCLPNDRSPSTARGIWCTSPTPGFIWFTKSVRVSGRATIMVYISSLDLCFVKIDFPWNGLQTTQSFSVASFKTFFLKQLLTLFIPSLTPIPSTSFSSIFPIASFPSLQLYFSPFSSYFYVNSQCTFWKSRSKFKYPSIVLQVSDILSNEETVIFKASVNWASKLQNKHGYLCYFDQLVSQR